MKNNILQRNMFINEVPRGMRTGNKRMQRRVRRTQYWLYQECEVRSGENK